MRLCTLVMGLFLFYSLRGFAIDCSATRGNLHRNLQTLQDVQNRDEESPFQVACKDPKGLLRGRPLTGLFQRSVPEKDQNGRRMRDFLNQILMKAQGRVSDSENQIHNLQTCLSPNAPNTCGELQNWAQKELPKYVAEARYHLSLAQSENQISSWVGYGSTRVNSDLGNEGSYKLTHWNALDAAEEARSQRVMDQYVGQIQQEYQRRAATGPVRQTEQAFQSQGLLAVRYQHYQHYHRMLSDVPLLQYLKGPSVSKGELQKAMNQMLKQLAKEKQKLLAIAEGMQGTGPLPTGSLALMRYSSMVEETLLDDPRDCGLATSALYTASNRELGTSFAIGLPIMAASMLAPPLAGVAMGLGAGGFFAFQSQQDYSDAKSRALGNLYGDAGGRDETDLEETLKQRNYAVATLPVGFGLGSKLSQSLVVRTGILGMAQKMFVNFRAPPPI